MIQQAPVQQPPRSPMRLASRIAFLAFIITFAWSFLLTGARFQSSDSMETFGDAKLIAAGKAPVSKYPPGQAFLFLPMALIEHWSANPDIFAKGTFWNERASNLVSNFSAAGIGFLMVLLLVELGFAPIAAGWLALLCSLGTILAPYGTYSFSEINLGFTLLAAFYLFLLYLNNHPSRSLLFFSGLFLGYSILLKANILILTPFFAIAIGLARPPLRSRRCLIDTAFFSLPLLASIYIYLLYNHWRFGSVLNFGYGQGNDGALGFHGSLFQGLFGQLLSPGKSMFLYSPVLIFSLWGWREFVRANRLFAWLSLATLLSLVALYSKWWCWAGDWSWGPRFLAPLTPLFFLPAAYVLRRLWANGRWWRTGIVALGLSSAAYQIIPSVVSPDNWTLMNTSSRLFTHSGRGQKIINYLAMEHFAPDCSPVIGMPWVFMRSIDTIWHIQNNQFGHFSVRWKGEILIPDEPGLALRANCGGAIKVKIDDKQIISQNNSAGATDAVPLNMKKGWHRIHVRYSYSKDKPFLSLEAKSDIAPVFKSIPTLHFRNGKNSLGLKAKYYLSSVFKRRWREQVDPAICFDWQGETPFQQWIRGGFPAGALYYEGVPSDVNFQKWMFYLNSWPTGFFYSADLRKNVSAWIALVIGLVMLIAAIRSLILETRIRHLHQTRS